MIVYGAHAAFEALRAGRATRLSLVARPGAAPAPNRRTADLVAEARRAGVPVDTISEEQASRLSERPAAPGRASPRSRRHEEWTPADLVAAAHAPALLVVLDGIEDPHNLGAILRTADAAGVDGVIRQARRSAPLDGRGGEDLGRRRRAPEDRHRGERHPRHRGDEGGRRLDGRPGLGRGRALRPDRLSPSRRPSWSAPRAPGSGASSGRPATTSRPSPWPAGCRA